MVRAAAKDEQEEEEDKQVLLLPLPPPFEESSTGTGGDNIKEQPSGKGVTQFRCVDDEVADEEDEGSTSCLARPTLLHVDGVCSD